MASTTALTMVNRLLRRHGFEDYVAFTAPETLLALDLVNQAVRDLLAQRDYPWNIRSDGVLRLYDTVSATSGASVSAGSTTLTITSATGSSTDYTGGSAAGELVARVQFTDSTLYGETEFRVIDLDIATGTMTATLAQAIPDAVSDGAYKFFFNEYLLTDTVAKVLSVRHEEQPIRLMEVGPHAAFDELMPRPHDIDGEPEVVMVGGLSTSTSVTGTTAAQRLRLMVWPIPDEDYLLKFSYKERVSELTTTTSTLVAPAEFVDDVIDRAEALSNMTQRFNAPELAQVQFRNATMTAERKWVNSVLDPNRRHSLRPHDSGTRRSDPTKYRDITGL